LQAANHVLWSGLFAALFASVCASTVGCYSPSPPLGIPCSSSQECPDGQECDLLTNVCGYPTETRTLRDDTAADFEGGALENAIIESGGFVGPIPYFIGGVRLAGLDGDQLDDGAIETVTFDDLVQLPVVGRGLARTANIYFGEEAPFSLGIDADNSTVLVEGEMYLDVVGTYMFQLRANDIGFLDIAPTGTTQYTRVVEAESNNFSTGTFEAPAAGWYRFRGAFADSAQFYEYEIRYDVPGPGSFRGIPADRLRARIDGIDGAMIDGFEEAYMLFFTGSAVGGMPFEAQLATDPFGLPVGVGTYSFRWTAQLLVDVEGAYRFDIDTSQGHRVWIDGVSVANVFNGAAQHTVTSDIQLAAGWHDIVFDFLKTGGGNGRASIGYAGGPAGTGAIPADHVRPVSARSVRWASDTNDSSIDVVDGMSASLTASIDVPAPITALSLDTGLYLTHPLQEQISITLDPPAGANIVLAAAGVLTGMGELYRRDSIPLDRSGTSFIITVADTLVDAMVGSLDGIAVTLSYAGGRPPFEPITTYTSTVREIGAARLGPVRWGLRQEFKQSTVSVRTCEEPTACDAEEWVGVLHGETPTVPARKYFQYKIEILNNEDVPTSLDWIEVEYVGYVEP
jgi:hypothetical protein